VKRRPAFLLYLFPRAFRHRYGRELLQVTHTARQRGDITTLALVADLCGAAAREWLGVFSVSHPRGRNLMQDAIRDLRHATRLLIRTPGFTLAAIVTLALAIGANTAIFGLVDATLLRPVHARQPERLVAWPWSSSYPDYVEYTKRTDLFEGVLGWRSDRVSVSVDGTTDLRSAAFVSGNAFSVLGVKPAAGRPLLPSDDVLNGPLVAMLSYDEWRNRFGGADSIIGRPLELNGRSVTIVGVVGEGHRGIALGESPSIYLPITAIPQLQTGFFAQPRIYQSRNLVWVNVVARLRQGVTREQASAAVDVVYRMANPPTTDEPLERLALASLTTQALGKQHGDSIERFVLLLMGVVGLTLLIGCASLANLLLARSASRRPEVGVRLAMGATPAQIARQMIFEHLVLAAIAGLSGIAVASLMLRVLSLYQLPGGVSIDRLDLSLGLPMLTAAASLSAITGVLFGSLPAWRAARTDVLTTLRDHGRADTPQTGLRSVLVAAQVALSLVLLTGSALFLQSLLRAVAAPLGFDVSGVITASAAPSAARYDAARARAFYDEAKQRVRHLPGITAAAWSSLIPSNGAMLAQVDVEGYQATAASPITLHFSYVEPEYFLAAGIRLVNGRPFSAADTSGSAPVAIISRAAARYWPGRNPLGGRIGSGDNWRTVVGVVENTTVSRLGEDAVAYVYFPFDQVSRGPWSAAEGAHLFVRTSGDVSAALASVASQLRSVDPQMPLHDIVPFATHVRGLVMPQQMGVTLLGAFGVLALGLAAIGIYGVAAYVSLLRTREIGIRLALGAEARHVRQLVLRQGVLPAALGIVAGVGLALWAARFARAFLYEVSPSDPVTFAAVATALLLVAAVASWLPARRAARVDPAGALRAQ
jgi:predicted permease